MTCTEMSALFARIRVHYLHSDECITFKGIGEQFAYNECTTCIERVGFCEDECTTRTNMRTPLVRRQVHYLHQMRESLAPGRAHYLHENERKTSTWMDALPAWRWVRCLPWNGCLTSMEIVVLFARSVHYVLKDECTNVIHLTIEISLPWLMKSWVLEANVELTYLKIEITMIGHYMHEIFSINHAWYISIHHEMRERDITEL
jgi:hypothetical protein